MRPRNNAVETVPEPTQADLDRMIDSIRKGWTATLTVRRLAPDDVGYREVYVKLDGRKLAMLRYGATLTESIEPGRHTLQVDNTLFKKTLALISAATLLSAAAACSPNGDDGSNATNGDASTSSGSDDGGTGLDAAAPASDGGTTTNGAANDAGTAPACTSTRVSRVSPGRNDLFRLAVRRFTGCTTRRITDRSILHPVLA